MIPTSTGTAQATALVIPELAGKMDGMAIRVPIPDGSVTDIVAELETKTNVEDINACSRTASQTPPRQGILAVSDDELVSIDIAGNPHSAIVDAPATRVLNGTTGKELVARALYYHGPRRQRPFVPVHYTAMPEGLLESELFGHTRGAFTGAAMARRGLFLEASRGTLFLDEVGDMPLGMQAKLLRVLEQRQIRPVGSDREVDIDVRVIAATRRDLEASVQQGSFREDLYYRLHVMVVQVPPLREHRDDIALLAETFLQRHAATNHVEARRLTPHALRRLEQHDWPGNVRELSHLIERGVTLSTSAWIDVDDVGLAEGPPPSRSTSPSNMGAAAQEVSPPSDTSLNLDDVTQHLVTVALQKTHGHKGQAATLLGVHPRTLTRMLRRYGLPDDL